MTNSWWQTRRISSLVSALGKMNASKDRQSSVDKCSELFGGLNTLWNEYHSYRTQNGELSHREQGNNASSDTESFIQLLQTGLDSTQKQTLCESSSLSTIVDLKPQIMDQDVLRSNQYDPDNISDELQSEAQYKHSELAQQFDRYKRQPRNSRIVNQLLACLVRLLYVIRSNIAHGEKTTVGRPDRKKADRDKKVCQAANPLLELIVELVFNHPSRRLALYGTLAPGQPNDFVLENVRGDYIEGKVEGHVSQSEGLPAFEWDISAGEVPVKLLSSEELPEKLTDIDRFEGDSYKRILIPVRLKNDTLTIANIYESKSA